jgi:gamma-glutamyltranspeptidase/glutathione hydrolase
VEKLMSKDYAAENARKKNFLSPHEHDRNPGSTTHFTVVDREGNIVCLTQTLGMAWGSGVMVPGTGIILNNHTNWMDPRPGRGNSIGPLKRPMAGYAPAIFFRNGRPWLAIGSPGSYRIPTAVAQVVLNRFHRDMPLQESVEASRIHFDAGPLEVEGNPPEGLSDVLRDGQFGLSRRPYPNHFFGGVNAVEMGEEGELFTGADPRRSCASEIAG